MEVQAQAQGQSSNERPQVPLDDDGLERDLRAVLGLDDPQGQAPAQDGATDTTEQETTSQQAGESAQASAPASEPLIDIGGEKVPLSQVLEWRKGYLRESDYTRKTQRLAERERELQQVMQQIQPLVHLQQLLQSNPAAARAFQQAYQAALSGQFQASGPAARPTAPPVGAQSVYPTPSAAALDPQIQQLRELAADLQLDRQLQELRRTIDEDRKAFGLSPLDDAAWQQAQEQVMREAVEQRIPDLRLAYRTSSLRDQLFREALAAVQRQQQEQQRAAATKAAGQVLRGRHVPTAGIKPPQGVPKTLSEATQRAFAELQAMGGLLTTDD